MKNFLVALIVLSTASLNSAYAQTTKTETTVDPSGSPTEPATDIKKVEKTETVETVETDTDDDRDSGGFFLEPAVTYETGKGEIDFKSIAQPDGDLEGFGLGLRFGGHVSDVLFLAVDTAYSEPEFTDENGNFDYDLKSWLAGITLGLQTPVVGLRVWGSYIPFGEITLDGRGSNDTNIAYKEPEMWKIGAGFRVAFVSLNLEYLRGDYTKLEVKNAGSLLSGDYDGNATRESWIASVSFPLAL